MPGGLINFKLLSGAVFNNSLNMLKRYSLSLIEIFENTTCGANRGDVVFVESKPTKSLGAKMILQRFFRILMSERPSRPRSHWHNSLNKTLRWILFADQTFCRIDPCQVVGQVRRQNCGCVKSTRRKFRPSDANLLRFPCRVDFERRDRRKIIGFQWIEKFIIGNCPWRDDSSQFPLDEAFRRFGIFDLFANGRPMSAFNQLANVGLQLVMRKSGHSHWVFALVAAR